jgi:hypothetical protein
MRLRALAPALFLLVVLTGCALMNQIMASWEGSHVRDLIASGARVLSQRAGDLGRTCG